MTDINLWCTELKRRFRDASGQALIKLEKHKYTLYDARDKKDPEQFVLKTLALGKAAHTTFSDQDAVLTAFEHTDIQLRCIITRPDEGTTLDQYMSRVNAARND